MRWMFSTVYGRLRMMADWQFALHAAVVGGHDVTKDTWFTDGQVDSHLEHMLDTSENLGGWYLLDVANAFQSIDPTGAFPGGWPDDFANQPETVGQVPLYGNDTTLDTSAFDGQQTRFHFDGDEEWLLVRGAPGQSFRVQADQVGTEVDACLKVFEWRFDMAGMPLVATGNGCSDPLVDTDLVLWDAPAVQGRWYAIRLTAWRRGRPLRSRGRAEGLAG